jgi:hypothetical protein
VIISRISVTVDEAADAHGQVGAMRLASGRIGGWLDGTFSTAPAAWAAVYARSSWLDRQ